MAKWSVCAKPGCPVLTEATHCPEHADIPWSRSTRRRRLPSDWSARRARVLKRDGWTCYCCGAFADQVDHVRNNDDHRDVNLAAICDECHKRKTHAESLRSRGHG